jgi:hypothetical protein
MLSKYLKDGQKFTVNPPDYEYPIRICLENTGGLIIWGFPTEKLKDFWSMMGDRVEVELVENSATQ